MEKVIKQIEKLIARQLKFERKLRSLSMKDMSNFLGISYQQYQKYETGKNRISAGKLICLLLVFNKSLPKFFSRITSELSDKILHNISHEDRAFMQGFLKEFYQATRVPNHEHARRIHNKNQQK